MSKYFAFCLVLLSTTISCFGQIRINEVCPMNYSTRYNQDGSRSDWIELKNIGNEDVNLKGWVISDKNDSNSGFIFPDTTIKAGEFLLLNCDEAKEFNNSYKINCRNGGMYKWDKNFGYSYRYKKQKGNFEMSFKLENWRGDITGNQKIGILILDNLENPNELYFASANRQNTLRNMEVLFCDDMQNKNINMGWLADEYYLSEFLIKVVRDDSLRFYFQRKGYFWEEKMVLPSPDSDELILGMAATSGHYYQAVEFDISEVLLNNEYPNIAEWNEHDAGSEIPGEWRKTNELFTSFKINNSGESLYLFDNGGAFIDSMAVPESRTDVSFGYDENSNLGFFSAPTPENENGTSLEAISETPQMKNTKNFFDSPEYIEFKDVPGTIYYTLDGNTPNTLSSVYTEPIHIDKNTPLRAIHIEPGNVQSEEFVQTIFINREDSELDFFALTVDSLLYWNEDPGKGLAGGDNYKHKWFFMPGAFEYYSPNEDLLYKAGCEVKIHGRASRELPQKSHRLTARSSLGAGKFKYEFFNNRDLKEYDKLLIRNGGNDGEGITCNDFVNSILAEDMNMESSRGKPVVMYLNGDYFGKFNVREKLDDDHFAEIYGISSESVTYIDMWEAKSGNCKRFDSLALAIEQFENYNSPEFEKLINDNFSIENVVDYFILNNYLANKDWILTNVMIWSSPEYDDRMRFVFWDTDNTYKENWIDVYAEISNNQEHSFNKFMHGFWSNENFRNYLINRTCDMMNTKLLSDNVKRIYDSTYALFASEMPRHRNRWYDTEINLDELLQAKHDFINIRFNKIFGQTGEKFAVGTSPAVTITSNIEKPDIRVNTIYPGEFPWSGRYFTEVEIELEARDISGYEFQGWEGAIKSSDRMVKYKPKANNSNDIKAVYKISGSSGAVVVINEIMYKSSDEFDSKDWVELYNAGGKDADLSGWLLKDSEIDHIFTIPDGTILKKGDYLVICKDQKDFSEVYPGVENIIGDFDFGLGEEDAVRLFDRAKNLVDKVEYTSSEPWYEVCFGEGPSLECINPKKNNSVPTNWKPCLKNGGTPGEINSSYSQVRNQTTSFAEVFPNPCDDFAIVSFISDQTGKFDIRVIDIEGNVILERSPKVLGSGKRSFKINISSLPVGVYSVVVYEPDGELKFTAKLVIER
jgi:hypothetical protein